jgi:NAD+ synthase (glutamine-hydrolysing)
VFDGHVIAVDRDAVFDEYWFEGSAVGMDVEGGRVSFPGPPAEPVVDAREVDDADLFSALVCGTGDYLRKTGFTKAILGLSGGIDSAVTAAIAVAAIGAGNVTGILLPSKYSSEHSVSDAELLARNLGMASVTVPIEAGVESLRRTIDPAFAGVGLAGLGARLPDLAEENLQSRVRGTILMAWSNRTGAIVLTTGNKSELAVGYCTLYGDMNGGLAVLSDVSKQWVYRLARWMNRRWAEAGFARPPIPVGSIEKPPSAELRPDQKDQDSLPEYHVLDAIIEALVERRESVAEASRRLGFDAVLVGRVARMIDLAEYKRKQAAIGLKVTSVAFGSGRRMPIAMRRG